MDETRYCGFEQDDFPEEEFKQDDRWGWIHKSGDTWHTVTGGPVNGGGAVDDPLADPAYDLNEGEDR